MTLDQKHTYRILQPHSDECSCHEWIFQTHHKGDPYAVYRDSIGRKVKHGYNRWLVLRCNNTDCFAQALLSEESVTQLLPPPEGTDAQGRKR